MRKIPTLFKRDLDDMRKVLPEVTPGCEWVLAGEGTATRKYDGTCCMFDGERWWARREVKPGKQAPANFQAIETDETTGKTVGWSLDEHTLIRHGEAEMILFGEVPAFDWLSEWMPSIPFEGIVWLHPDGRMAKLKRRDFAR